jgi:hypothetical protein
MLANYPCEFALKRGVYPVGFMKIDQQPYPSLQQWIEEQTFLALEPL